LDKPREYISRIHSIHLSLVYSGTDARSAVLYNNPKQGGITSSIYPNIFLHRLRIAAACSHVCSIQNNIVETAVHSFIHSFGWTTHDGIGSIAHHMQKHRLQYDSSLLIFSFYQTLLCYRTRHHPAPLVFEHSSMNPFLV